VVAKEEEAVLDEGEKAAKKPAREKRVGTKKRVVREREMVQGDLWG
jgi:hypothetical protein